MIYDNYKKGESFWSYWWYHLHLLGEYYPENPTNRHKEQIQLLMKALSVQIRCGICRRHFNHYIQHHDYHQYLNSKRLLRKYFIDFHNDVNNKKKKKILELPKVIKFYQHPKVKLKVIHKTGLDICQYFDSGRIVLFVKMMNQTAYLSEKKRIVNKITDKEKKIIKNDKKIDTNKSMIVEKITEPDKKKKKDSESQKINIDKKEWKCYLTKYEDLNNNYLSKKWPCNQKQALRHWNNNGRKEGRTWGCS